MLYCLARKYTVLLVVVMLTLALTSCRSSQAPAGDPSTQNAAATVAALSTENARLATQVAQLAAAATPQPPVAPEPAGQPMPDVQVAPAGTAQDGPLPTVIATIPLSSGDAEIKDVLLDPALNRVYVSDTGGQTHVVDAATYEVMAVLPVSGNLLLDAEHDRLYVATADLFVPEHEEPSISVIDTQSLALVGTIAGSRYVAVDPGRDRIFAGNPVYVGMPEDAPGVLVYDGATLEQVGEVAQAGVPVFNPLRDELMIVAYTVYTADPATLQVTGDLLPELTQQALPWCNGCEWTDSVQVFPSEGLVALFVNPHCPQGCGVEPQPRFLDAATLEPVQNFSEIPSIQPVCGSHALLLGPVQDNVYRNLLYLRYIVMANLDVYAPDGALTTWRDGLRTRFINPHTSQLYAEGGRVLELATLTPLGSWPEICIFAHDASGGRLFGGAYSDRGSLVVLSETGAQPAPPPPPVAEPLPALPITAIALSPSFANDHTLYAVILDNRIYRSVDGGQTWSRLQGGLPPNPVKLDLVMSPEFANDHTLYVGAYTSEPVGDGVLRSTDRGDTWQPVWNGLTHLRVYDVAVSSTYSEDGTLLAYAKYNRLDTWDSGASIHRSTDRGLTWSLVVTSSSELYLPPAAELLPPADAPALPLRIADYGTQLERTADGGATWQRVDLDKPDDVRILAILPSPFYADDGTIYVLGEYELWRTIDDGMSWERWADPRLEGRNYTNRLSAGAISSPLPDGDYQILIGTYAGEFWVLTPAGLHDQSMAPVAPAIGQSPLESPLESPLAAPTTALLPTPTPTPTLTPPPPLAGEPTDGLFRPLGALASLWDSNTAVQQALGWATRQDAASTSAAIQLFENGMMLWRGDTQQYDVLSYDHVWDVFDDTYKEGEPEKDTTIDAPDTLEQPIRGFGKVWRENPTVREKLGWALDEEKGYTAFVHDFERGFLIGSPLATYAVGHLPDGAKTWY